MAVHELEIEAAKENLPAVTAFIEEQLERAGCPLKSQMQITVAAEEIFVNIASYAYAPGTGWSKLCLEVFPEPAVAVLTFLDRGTPYDPTAKADPDVTLSAAEREIGGLGIFMTKKIMDEVRYEYRDGMNMLTLIKKL